MNPWWFLVLVTILSWLLTGLLRRYALKQNLLDVPNVRSSHSVVTPRGGGLSIVLIFLLSVTLLFVFSGMPFDIFMAIFGGGVLVSGIGFLDDHGHVPARWRILVHFTAAFWAMAWLDGLPLIPIGNVQLDMGWFGYLVGALLIVWLLNLFNFMDGIDGIAGVEAVSIAGSAALILIIMDVQNQPLWLGLIVAACLGFLVWNWPPARIFMGDAASGFLGFVLGVFMMIAASDGFIPIWAWLTLFGVFFVDATVTLIRRFSAGKKWYEAHCSHAYQHAARYCGSHKAVTLTVLIINVVWLLPLALFGSLFQQWSLFMMIIAYAPLVMLALRFNAGLDVEELSIPN